jgi:hypothetical protein
MAEAAAASTVKFKVPEADAFPCLAQPHEPHRLTLRASGGGFTVPAGRFSVLEGHKGVIHRLRATPHLEYLNREAAIDLSWSLAMAQGAAGWLPQELRTRAVLTSRVQEDGEDRASVWTWGEWTSEVWIRRAVEANSPTGRFLSMIDDGHLVTIVIWNAKLVAAAEGG